ncbi:MAG: AMP-binding protein, partial [Pseudomonadota bacterium]
MRHFDWLDYHARVRPDAPCWTDLHSDRTFSFAAANDRCRRLAAHLQTRCGVRRGDRVGVLAMNSSDVMEAHSACAKIGAIFLPLNWRLEAPEIDFIVGDAAPQALIHDGSTAEIVS